MCLLCGERELLGLPVCPDCGVTSPKVADTLVFVKPDPVHADRLRIARTLEGLLSGRTHAEHRRLVAAGHRALIRVPGASAGRVLEYLADIGVPAVARPTRRVWGSVPSLLYVIVAAVVVFGLAAGLTTIPMFLWSSPLFAALLLVAAQTRLRQPVIEANGRPAFASKSGPEAVSTLAALPEGQARDLLAQLVKAAQPLARGPQAPDVAQILKLACRAATDLADLDAGIPHLDWPGSKRSQPLHDALARRLADATRVLHRLRAETVGLEPTRAVLAELIEELELEADAYAEARRELALI